jgi:hypothetical protein
MSDALSSIRKITGTLSGRRFSSLKRDILNDNSIIGLPDIFEI